MTKRRQEAILNIASKKAILEGVPQMRAINTVDLKNQTNQVLRTVRRGKPVVVTLHGRLCAAIIPLKEEDLDDLIFEYSPYLRKLIAEAEADIRAGRTVSWQDFLKHEQSHSS